MIIILNAGDIKIVTATLRATTKTNSQLLIVDADLALRRIIASIIGNRGYALLEADNGVTAIQQLSINSGNLALALVELSEVSAANQGLIQWLLTKPIYANTTIVGLAVQPELEVEALLAGCHAFLLKPFQPAQLLALVHDQPQGWPQYC